MNRVSLAFLTTLLLASVVSAQKRTMTPLPAKGPVKSFQIGSGQPKSTSASVYSNTLFTGYYFNSWYGEEFLDWGDARPTVAEHGTVIGGTFGYGTSAASRPSVRWRTYDGYTGGCVSLSPGGLDILISQLPTTIFTTGSTVWSISVDLEDFGACFYLPTGSFGYSMTFYDSASGPLLSSGDSAANMIDWVLSSTGSCSPGFWFGGSPWAGFHTEFIGWKTSGSFGSGCNGPISLSATGNSCPGGTLNVSFAGSGPDPIPFSALGLGTVVGAGIGGPLHAGCDWDIGLAIGAPPASVILGPQPVSLSFGATTCASAVPGTVIAAQWVQKDTITGTLSTSNVAQIFVP